jgi:L-amino acid N-acyltransferase YncA
MNITHKLVNRLRRRPGFSYLVIYAKTLDELLPIYQARIPFEFEVLPANVEEIEKELAHIPYEHRSDIERRISNGDRCFVAKSSNCIVHVDWVAFGKCYSYLLDREYELATDECYGYSAYTLLEFRGMGIQPATTYRRNKLLRDWGYRRVFAFIEKQNKAALRMPEKLSYEKIGYTGFTEIFGLRRYFHWDQGIFTALKKRGYWEKR